MSLSPSSLTDWLQTGIQFVTFVGVAVYTGITWRMFREAKSQNKSIAAQLELQRLSFEKDREMRDEESRPIFQWSSNHSINTSARTYGTSMENKGKPVRDLVITVPGATSTITVNPTDYISSSVTVSVQMVLPVPEIEGRQGFKIHVTYTTMTGMRGEDIFETLLSSAPRMIGSKRL